MAKGIDGIKVAGRDGTSTLHAYVLQFTTDMPGGDKLLNAKGHNGQCPGRFRSSASASKSGTTTPCRPIPAEKDAIQHPKVCYAASNCP